MTLNYNNDICSVCLEEFENDPPNQSSTSLECGHTFHVKCIIKCLRKSNECPNCRDTDGNPKISVQNDSNLHFIWGDDDDQSEYDTLMEEYNDFKQIMTDLRKNNKQIKQEVANYKNEYKQYEQRFLFINNKYQTGLNNAANEYLKSFRLDPDYIRYNEERFHMQKKYYFLRKKIANELSKNLDLEIDAEIKDFVKDYVNDEIGEYYYFSLPRSISI
jgi:TRAF-interacting protein